MSEESNWNDFQQDLAKRRMKYDKNLPENCEGCMAGARWKVDEMVTLIKELRAVNGLNHLCMLLNRPKFGIMGRLSKMGLVYMHQEIGRRGKRYPNAYCSPSMSVTRFKSLPKEVQEALVDCGWQVQHIVVAPRWWRDAIIKDDIRNHK
ncbi:hypothetical protein [Serratia phage vB_SmaM_Hera]|uniref:Uncharacterized protein n=1 Tax=Serratia phage vB_SmaM_Hera TaxID=2777369 RepID=A0A7T3N976_9CAUD|nr:hypothetical protein [Serratia phage vB_SmaM_Hera]